MGHYLKKILIFLVAVAVTSCAQKDDRDYTEDRLEVFKLWMDKNHPNAVEVSEGIYVEWIEEGPKQKKLYEGYWIKLNYTGRLLNGDYYVTRNKELAKKLNIFTTSNYYAPEYLPFYPASVEEDSYPALANLAEGQAKFLKNMYEGDSVRLYLYQTEAYPNGYSIMTGYGVTNASIGLNVSVIMDMKLTEIVPDPEIHERNLLEAFVVDSMDMDIADYYEEGLYIKKIKERTDTEMVDEESLVSVYYTGRLLDGFIFDTNDQEVAFANDIYNSENNYSLWEFYPNDDAEAIEGFLKALKTMRYGEKIRVAMLSELAYGASGNGSAIPPYSSLVFDIHVMAADDF